MIIYASLCVIVIIGIFLSKLNWLNNNVADNITKIIINITLPCTIIISLNNNLSELLSKNISIIFIVPIITYVIGLIISVIFKRILYVNKKEYGIFLTAFVFQSIGFVGIPVIQVFFKQEGLMYLACVYVVHNILFWTIGHYLLKKTKDNREKNSIFSQINKLISPPIIAIIISFIIVLAGINLSGFIYNTIEYLSKITTPLALLITGFIIYNNGLNGLKICKKTLVIVTGKVLIMPLIMLFISWIFGLEKNIRNIFIIIMALPCMLQILIFAKIYKLEVKIASKCIIWSNISSFVLIPIYEKVLDYI